MTYDDPAKNAKPVIMIDLRCLQDTKHAERGIPAHSRNAVLLAREVSPLARAARIIGLTDPKLPDLPAEIAAALDEISSTGYLPDLPAGAIFLNPAPMNQDQLLFARLLLDKNIRKAALVYDFIPLDEPGPYIRRLPDRLDYYTALAWLKHYDLFLPISTVTQTRLAELFGPRDCVVTGVPIAAWLQPDEVPQAAPPHILAVAGADPRKNPEVLIRAHAASKILQDMQIKLIITGNYSALQCTEFQALCTAHGGRTGLLVLPGRMPADSLRELYRQAICVVTASRAEGFSMPVIEAMACGVPSIASDIPVHAALVKDPRLRFGADDDAALMSLLERFVTQPAFRRQTIAAQADIWPPFTARAVAAKIWSSIERMPAPQRFHIGRRPRIAMLTPLPPARSGVANYSAALAGELAKLADLSLFSPSPAPGAHAVSGQPYLSPRFDRVVSIIGNSFHHHDIYRHATRFGSACICHDARLLSLMIRQDGPARAAAMASREIGRKVAEAEIIAWERDETMREADFFGDLANTARPLMFHSRHSVAGISTRFNRNAVFLPFAVYAPGADTPVSGAAQTGAKARLGFSAAEVLICSFGIIHPSKGIEPALRAMVLLKQSGIAARLIWVGETRYGLAAFEKRAAQLGLSANVSFGKAFVPEATMRDYLLAADFGLQLRIGRAGNMSGALQDCIAAGLPGVANFDLAENLSAPGYIHRVDDRLDPKEIADALRLLINAGLPRENFEAERATYCETYSMARYARALCDAFGGMSRVDLAKFTFFHEHSEAEANCLPKTPDLHHCIGRLH